MQVSIAFRDATDPALATVTFRPYTFHPDADARSFPVRRVAGGWLYLHPDAAPVIFPTADAMLDALRRIAYPYGPA